MKKLLFVYNPNAGTGALKQHLMDVIDIFVKAGYEVTVYPTQKYRDGYHKVKNFGDEYELLVCSGGDGTLDEAVSGMMRRDKKIPIGYIRQVQQMILQTVCIFQRIYEKQRMWL